MCEEWDPDLGGNYALVTPYSGEPVAVIPEGPTLLNSVSHVEYVDYDDLASVTTPDDNYCNHLDSDRLTLGKVGGVPLWIQGDETPLCDCGSTMRFVVQLECNGGGGINFGDMGAGYGFICLSCDASAKFLWQCG